MLWLLTSRVKNINSSGLPCTSGLSQENQNLLEKNKSRLPSENVKLCFLLLRIFSNAHWDFIVKHTDCPHFPWQNPPLLIIEMDVKKFDELVGTKPCFFSTRAATAQLSESGKVAAARPSDGADSHPYQLCVSYKTVQHENCFPPNSLQGTTEYTVIKNVPLRRQVHQTATTATAMFKPQRE